MEGVNLLLGLLIMVVTTWAQSGIAQEDITNVSYANYDLFMDTADTVYHMELDLYKSDGSILFSSGKYLQTTDGKTVSTVTPTNSSSSLNSFEQVNSTRVVLVITYQNCIKILNRENGQQKTLAGTCGSAGYIEGKVGAGKLYYPWDAKLDVRNPGRLFVTDSRNNALRAVDLQTGELSTVTKFDFSNPKGMWWAENNLLVANDHYISEVSWLNSKTVTNTIVTGHTSSYGLTDGSFSNARLYSPYDVIEVGHKLYFINDYSNRRIRLMNMNTRMVGPVCFRDEESCKTGSQSTTYVYSLLKVGQDVYVGMGRDIYVLSGSDIPAPAICPNQDKTAYVEPGKQTAEIQLPNGPVGDFPPGVYSFREDYQSKICTFKVNVLYRETLLHCSYNNITAFIEPGEQRAKVQLPGGDIGRLSSGIHVFTKQHGPNSCSYYVSVRKSAVVRTAVFRTEYDVTCDVLNDSATKGFLQTILTHRKDQLQNICGKNCLMSTVLQPSYSCKNNLLVINWPTDQEFAIDTKEVPDSLARPLRERLNQSNNRYSQIPLLTHQPPLVFAKKNQKGESVQIVLSGSCADENQAYDASTDTCN